MPEKLGRYEILAELGRGGFAVVHRAKDTELDRQVALKELRSTFLNDTEWLKRFKREARTIAKLNHSHIVTIHDVLETDDRLFIVMRLVDGPSLEQVIAAEGRLPWSQTLDIITTVAEALDYAHARDILHRDLKPANILLDEERGPQLSDFGLAKLASEGGSSVTAAGAIVGTPNYISPEMWEVQGSSKQSDIYALGCILYEMLTGEKLFGGDSPPAVMMAHFSPPTLPDTWPQGVPSGVAKVIQQALAKDPDDRYASTIDFITALQQLSAAPPQAVEITEESPGETQTDAGVLAEAPSQIRHNLPAQPTPFIGRTAELMALADLIANPEVRLVTIVGPGGMGKTRLALAAAERQLSQARFVNGLYFVSLAPLSEIEHIVPTIAEALSFTFYGGSPPQQQLLDYLHRKQMLLILDNFEHLLDGVELVADILQAAPGVQILATSRERLLLHEEQVYPIQGLEFPDWETGAAPAALDEAAEYTAVKLFLQSAQRVQPNFELVAADLADLARICRLVDGMPLGVELAAAWVKMLSPANIAAEIRKSLDFLETDVRNVPRRHRSMRAVFDASWQQMHKTEQEIFARLSVFRGGFTRPAAQEISGASLKLLGTLAGKSLIQYNKTLDRYQVHELLRQYGAEQLQLNATGTNAIRAAHARYFADFLHMKRDELRGGRQVEALAEIAVELDNVRTSWAWAVEHADIALIGKSLESLYYFSEVRGRARDGEAALRQAVVRLTELGADRPETAVEEHKLILGQLMFRHGDLVARLGLWEQAVASMQQAMSLFRQVKHGAEVHLAATLNKLALTSYFISGEAEKAHQFAQEALALATAAGDKFETAYAYNVMGHLAEFQGKYVEAGPLFAQSIGHYEQIGERRACAYAQNNWGRAAYAIGEYEQAGQLIQAALTVRREFGDLIGMSYSLLDLGKLAKMRGQYAQAGHYVREALRIAEEIGVRDTVARCYHGLGMIAEGLGDFEEAEVLHRQSLTISRETGVKRALPLLLNHLSRTAYERGDYPLAEQRLKEALSACAEMKNRGEQGSALRHLGHVAVATGNYAAAGQHFRQALEILAETGARPVALDVIVGSATLLMENNPTGVDRLQAIELLALVQHHPASEHETKEKAKRLLPEWADSLSPEELTSTLARGRELDLWQTAAGLFEEISE